MDNSKEKVKRKGVIKKIILSILGIFLIAIAVGVGILQSTVSCINKEYTMEETVLGKGEKTALLIYEPSKHDTAKEVSMSVAQIMVDHGYTVTINCPTKELVYDWEKYDVIALGSPIYAGKVSPVLKDYVTRNPIENKNLLLYSIGSAPVENTTEIDEMNTWVSEKNNIVKTKCKIDERVTFENYIDKTLTDWE
ncbi:MAG: flavodoxin domain-containing protein [Lachnospiraceae bacterium]|nr:flavodoxin domain-containing protein [Lachnospiraceae bacterium]